MNPGDWTCEVCGLPQQPHAEAHVQTLHAISDRIAALESRAPRTGPFLIGLALAVAAWFAANAAYRMWEAWQVIG